ncbi:MAG TPA: hypothetical protein VN885_05090 [Candidatus Acidoferrales bacterium]|nr:hypothetical protein [Candidatus Acidoferrales bacterium]
MSSLRPRFGSSFLLVVAIVALAPTVRAQCATGGVGYNGMFVAMTPNNPFHALLTMTNSKMPRTFQEHPVEISRDQDGRVRVDRFVSDVQVQSGQGAGTEMEERAVTIYDPLKCEAIQLNNVSHSAAIGHLWAGPLAHPRPAAVATCGSEFEGKARAKDATSEDLGHQTIDGFDAIGIRSTMHPHIPDATPEAVIDRVTETWCSPDLQADLLQVMHGATGAEPMTVSLTAIQRTEPEPSLFEIPPDYTVSETVAPHPATSLSPSR